MKKIIALSLAASLAIAQPGCAVKDRVTNVDNTFLTDVDISSKLSNLPFDHSWVRPGFSKNQYDGFYLKPVRMDLLASNAWVKSASVTVRSKEDYDNKAREVASYFQTRLEEEMKQKLPPKFAIYDRPAPGAIVIEVALTELELSHPVARAAALASPIPGTGAALSTMSDPHVAFAIRFTDPQSGVLLASAADRKFPPARILDLNKFTVSSSAREVCSLWATSITDSIEAGRFSDVKEKKFSFWLW